MEIFCTSIYILLIIFLIYRWNFFKLSGIKTEKLLFLFLLKITFCFAIYFVYTRYYTIRETADIFKYFDDAELLYNNVYLKSPSNYWKIIFGINNESNQIHHELKQTQYWFKPHETNIFNDNRTIIRFNAAIYLISFGYYHIHSIILCFLSFIGLVALYRTFIYYFEERKKILIYPIFLIPSVLFWGSGILKESILIFSLGLFMLTFNHCLHLKKRVLINSIVLLISLFLLAITKTYVLLTLIPSTTAWIVCWKYTKLKPTITFLVINIFYILLAFQLKYIHPSLDVPGNIRFKQIDFINVAKETKSGSRITITPLTESILSYLNNAPQALLNSLFRPTIFECNSVLTIFACIENCIFSVLILCAFIFFKKPTRNQKIVILFCIFFTLCLSLLIGYVVPVVGAIVRYKVPLLPFVCAALCMCIDTQKIIKLQSLYKKR